jgi:hypothetical protein
MNISLPDLFPETTPPADPLMGRAVSLAHVCWRCGTNIALINPGRGPHTAELRCRNCDAHVQWLGRADYQEIAKFFAEIGSLFGAPAEILYRVKPREQTGEQTMGNFEQRDFSGILFRNDRKDKDTDRDYRGEAKIDGREYRVSGWVKDGKRGKFMTFAFKPKDEAKASGAAAPFNDEVGF